MKPLTLFAAVLCLCSSLNALAQKDAPVAGDAATLADLLKKDYNAIDPENRLDEISKDRTLVIGIFKSYLSDDSKKNLATTGDLTALNKSLDNYNKLKKRLAAFPAVTTNIPTAVEVARTTDQVAKVSFSVDSAKREYFARKFGVDDQELQAINDQYDNATVDNQYVAFVIQLFMTKFAALNAGTIDQLAVANASSTLQKSIPFLGGDDGFSLAVDGLAKFLAKRLKEELTAYVIDRVKAWLQNPNQDNPFTELKVLLPQTTAYLSGFSADKITNFPTEIKGYIENDINHLLDNAPNLRNTPRIQKLINSHPDLDFAFEALEIIPGLSKLKTPVDYFNLLENSRNLSRWKTLPNATDATEHNIANTIYMTSMLARSLMVIDNGEAKFAGASFLTSHATDLNFNLLYVGFLYQQNFKYYQITFKGTPDFDLDAQLKLVVYKDLSNLATIKDDIAFFQDMLAKTTKSADKIYELATEIKKANQSEKKIGADTIYAYAGTIIDFAQEITATTDTLMFKLVSDYNLVHLPAAAAAPFPLKKTVTPYFTIARASNEIFNDLHHQKYAQALLKGVQLSASFIPDNHFAGITVALQNISYLQFDAGAFSWTNMLDSIGRTAMHPSLKFDDPFKKSLTLVSAELNKLVLYYNINYPGGTLKAGLGTFKTLCNSGIQLATFASLDLTAVRGLIADPDFQRLLLSYYTSTDLAKLEKEVTADMKAFTIKDVAGNPVRVFEDDDITNLLKGLDAYLDALYQNYYVQGRKDVSPELAAKKSALLTTVTSYFSVLPQRFDIGANTQLVSLINFVSDIAQAKNSDDMEKAIEAFALPAGSYTVKRSSRFNFTLNSYPGILPAYELTWKDKKTSGAFTAGFTAPVGFGLSWGSTSGSVDGLFIPVIDIGAITRIRFKASADSAGSLPEFTFKNIFAPGIYYSHGFKKSPLAVNIGFQYGPQLRQITTSATGTQTTSFYDSIRIGIGFVFDIPLFNLSTKPRD